MHFSNVVDDEGEKKRMKMRTSMLLGLLSLSASVTGSPHESTNLYWGDTHLHTAYSADAFLSQNYSSTPDTAYRWAKGQPVIHPYTRAKVRINTPLDFLVVSDHAEGLGVIRAIVNEKEELGGDLSIWEELLRWYALRSVRHRVAENEGGDVFRNALPMKAENPGTDPVQDPSNQRAGRLFGDISKTRATAWGEIVSAAERHNDPGKFTAFLGWEWSSVPTGVNLHRVVMTPNGEAEASQYLPYGSDQSQYPEDLWAWLKQTAETTGSEFLAIPHNSNLSKGYMFPEVTLRGQPIDVSYARTRLAWEPVVEVTQIKGDSETHSELSPDDALSDFENYPFYLQQSAEEYKVTKADFIRAGLRTGLEIEDSIGVNPYQFGLIGSTDSHTGLSSAEEDNFWGKFAIDATPSTKQQDLIGGTSASGWNMSASGLAAVWANENTRESIFAAFKRREVYATTGPRLSVRFFGGWGFDEGAELAENLADIGYQQGVPMGGNLIATGFQRSRIQFLIRAVKDPQGANLDRVQVVKGWLDEDSNSHEKVFNVVWSDDRQADETGELPTVGDTVDRETASYENSIGSPELAALWTDPTFNASQRAFYYLRVLQIPTPRHSLYDAVAAQIEVPDEGPPVIQERAYTSPIWYTP